MISIFLSLLAIFLLLVTSQYLWNNKILKGEAGRKFVHIAVGTFVATWPFYMSFSAIQVISLAFLVVVLLARKFKIFSAVHTVNRNSWGDVLFAIGIGMTAVLATSDWIFAVAILNLSLADGLAGIIGKNYGKSSGYKVFGYSKSVAGTVSFWLASLAILLVANHFGDLNIGITTIILLPILTAIVENIGILGADNIAVPLLVVLSLRLI